MSNFWLFMQVLWIDGYANLALRSTRISGKERLKEHFYLFINKKKPSLIRCTHDFDSEDDLDVHMNNDDDNNVIKRETEKESYRLLLFDR